MREPVAPTSPRQGVTVPRLLVAFILGVATASCGSDGITATGPSPAKCQLSLAVTSTIDASGGTGQVAVATTPECAWTATTEAAWVSGISPASGQGTGQIEFHVAANLLPTAREGAVIVNGQRALIRQEAAACRLEIAPEAHDIGASGGFASSTVTTLAGCAWTVTSDASWITVTPTAGNGSGTLNLAIAASDGNERAGGVRVGDRLLVIRQGAATSCSVVIAPANQTIGVAGGAGGLITVTAGAHCAWTAVSNVAWVTVTGGASGGGNGVVTYNVGANPGSGRTGTLSIAGQTFTVTQASLASCAYTLTPPTHSIGPSDGVALRVQVSTTSGCAWTASSNVSWVTIVGGASGNGNGTVTYDVAANTGGTRTATMTIAGHAFTLTQDSAACSFTISPSNTTINAAGGAGTPINLSTSTACTWSVATDASWITITSPPTGSGATTVTYNVAANSGGERRGVISVGGQSFSVTQAVACSYRLASTSHSAPPGAGAVTLVVTAPSGCSWTAASNAAWITVNSGQTGNGNGSVLLTVATNTGPSRTGTVVIAGQTLTVTQGSACAYSIAPPSQSIGFEGGLGTPVAVTAASGCTWTAASNVPWIVVAAGQTGAGNGSVTFLVTPNTGSSRTGTLTIAGETFTVTQAAILRVATLSRRRAPTTGPKFTVTRVTD